MPQENDDNRGARATSHEARGSPGANDAVSGYDEAALIRAAQQNLALFGPIYARYVDRIYSYLLTRTGQAQGDAAADLTQQAFVQALDALPRYQPREGGSVVAWLFRIARNAATDWQRRQRPTVPWEATPEEQHPHAPDTADGPALRREEIAEARRLLATLDEPTRELLLLRFTAQLTFAEIGGVLGITEEAARKRITRALHTLKERYDANTHDTP